MHYFQTHLFFRNQERIFTISVFISILFFLNGCELIEGETDPENDTTVLDGEWFRIESNNPANDNMVIEVENSAGVITDKANAVSFNVGDVKWNSIIAQSDTEFDYQELGSDGNYYAATMKLADDTTLLLSVVSSGAGNAQRWLRSGSVYTPPAVTRVLDCKVNSALLLENGPAEVDYRVECVVDITAPLTIEAGVVIEFAENAGFGVYDNGSLKAVGDADNKIVFQGAQDVSGYWRGIHIETRTLNNQLSYIEIKNAGSNYVYCCNEATGILLKGGLLAMDNVTISSGGGSGLVVTKDAEFGSFNNVTVTGHDSYPIITVANALQYYGDPNNDFSGNTKDYIYVSKSDISEALVWKAAGIPYLLSGTVMDITAPLTIEAGTEIAVEADGGIGVYDSGSLKVNGSSENPVIIRGKEALAGYWRGIHMETNSINNDLNYFEIHDAGSNYVYCCNIKAALFLKAGRCAISNLTIGRAAEYGIVAKKDFTFSEFTNVNISSELEPLFLAAERAGEIEANSNLSGGTSHNFIKLENSNIETPVVMKDQNIPYLIDFVLDITAALTVEAGVNMVFMPGGGLGVYDAGSLSIQGTDANNVVLTGFEEIQGYWRGIHTETNSAANSIEHARILYAGGNYVYCCNDKTALLVKAGTFSLKNSEISNSGGFGFLVKSGASLVQSGNTYNNNAEGNSDLN